MSQQDWNKLQIEVENSGRLMAAIGSMSGQYKRLSEAAAIVQQQHAALLAAARAVVEKPGPVFTECGSLYHEVDLERIRALRAAVEAAGREEE
jgi:hypothetical protein